MAGKGKTVWVVATLRGQLADKSWRDENSLPFKIPEAQFSKRWMKEIDADDAKAKLAGADSVAGLAALAESENDTIRELTEAGKLAAENLERAEKERDDAEKERDDLKAKLDDLTSGNASLKSAASAKGVASGDTPHTSSGAQ